MFAGLNADLELNSLRLSFGDKKTRSLQTCLSHLPTHPLPIDTYQIYPLLEPFVRLSKPATAVESNGCGAAEEEGESARGDRLVRLLVKGLLYEACVDYCALMATERQAQMQITGLLGGELSMCASLDYS